jgi:hypothetical protein
MIEPCHLQMSQDFAVEFVTNFPFPAFNVRSSQPLKLKERPLVVIEVTAIDEGYIMNLSVENDSDWQLMQQYRQRCYLFNGDFTLLWHNSRLL